MRSMTLRKAKQKGFTLLELLVVITLLAILATGALLAYEGLTDTAQGAAASNNTATADQSIRNYKAVTQNYPDQWDNLVVAGDGASAVPVSGAGALPAFFNQNAMGSFLASLDLTAVAGEIAESLEAVGIGEIQSRLNPALTTNVEPNLQHNEGAVALRDANFATAPDVVEVDTDELTSVAIVPSFRATAGACTLESGTYPTTKLNVAATAIAAADGRFLNKINDKLEENECHLVVALGFGNDAAKSTSGTAVAIAAAPTYSSRNINPNTQYARYIGLFHVGADNGANGGTADDGIIQDVEIFQKARLIAVVDTEGKVIDQNIAAATDTTAN